MLYEMAVTESVRNHRSTKTEGCWVWSSHVNWIQQYWPRIKHLFKNEPSSWTNIILSKFTFSYKRPRCFSNKNPPLEVHSATNLIASKPLQPCVFKRQQKCEIYIPTSEKKQHLQFTTNRLLSFLVEWPVIKKRFLKKQKLPEVRWNQMLDLTSFCDFISLGTRAANLTTL